MVILSTYYAHMPCAYLVPVERCQRAWDSLGSELQTGESGLLATVRVQGMESRYSGRGAGAFHP